MYKLKFKNGINGVWADWTSQSTAFSIGAIKRRLESKNPGESGIVTFDKVGLTLGYESGNNPVYNAFSGNLTAVERYIFSISGIKEDKSESKVFEGLADFSTLSYPDDEKKVRFDVVDKLKALDVITNTNTQRGNAFSLASRLATWAPDATRVTGFSGAGSGGKFPGHDWSAFGAYGDLVCFVAFKDNGTYWGQPISNEVLMVEQGETIIDNGKLFLVLDSKVQTVPVTIANTIGFYVACTMAKVMKLETETMVLGVVDPVVYPATYFNQATGFITIGTSTPDADGMYPVQAFDAFKLFQLILQNAWSDITIINLTGLITFPVNLSYFTLLIDENPFGKHPFDALKMIADSMRCYIFFNKQGNLVIKKKIDIATGTLRTFSQTRKKGGNAKNYFWDKLADAVTVNVVSGKTINGITLTGSGTWRKYPGIKPRNEITIDIVAPETIAITQDALNTYALTIAGEIGNFYGKRHWYYSIKSGLTDDMLDWELLDTINIGGELYFITSIDINLVGPVCNFELVSVTGYDYNINQAQRTLSQKEYLNSSSPSGGVVGSTSATINIIPQSPLVLTGAIISLDYETNLKLSTANKLDTIQDIKTTSTTIQFERIGFGGVTDTVYKVKNYGDEWIVGNQKIDGMQSIGGVADPLFKQKIYGHAKVTGDLTVDGNLYLGGVINQVNVVDLNVADHAIRLNKGGDNTTALDGGIEMLGLADALLGSIKYQNTKWLSDLNFDLAVGKAYQINGASVLTTTALGGTVVSSSLTSVGTLATGVWNATAINGQYINYNTTNLKVTTNQLNTIQDISTSASPQFARLGLGLAADASYSLKTAGNIFITGTGSSFFDGNNSLSTYASRTAGWRISNLGEADFRYLYTDELHAKFFIADLEQALAGGQIITKSVAKVAGDFTIPTAGNSGSLIVEEFAGFTGQVFADGDIVLLRQQARTGGNSLSISNCWGTVIYVSRSGAVDPPTQTFTFTRSATYPGTATGTINKNSLALDFGQTSGGYYEVNAADGNNSPYMQIVTWATHPGAGLTTRLRAGKLDGISDADFGGSLSGYGLYLNDGGKIYLKGNMFVKSSTALALAQSTIMIGNITGTAPSAIKLSQTGTAATSGLFGYTGVGEESFALRLDGTASIAGWNFGAGDIRKTIGTSPNTKFVSLAAMSSSLSASGGNYPVLAMADNQYPMYISVGHAYYKAAFQNEFGFTFANDPFNALADPIFQVTKNMTSGTLTTKLAGWNFNASTLYGVNTSKYTGMQAPAALSTKCFFAGATDNIGTGSRFFVQADGKIVTADVNGNVLFDSDTIYADLKNIGRVFYSDTTQYTLTNTVYVTVKQGTIFLLPNETTIQLVFRAWINGASTTATGKIRLKLEQVAQWPASNAEIGNYEAAVYSNEVTFGNGETACFDYYHTIIKTPDGEKFLYELEHGDKVVSFNEEKRCLEISEVEEIITSEADEYYLIDGVTRVTGEHPLFVNLNAGGWMKVKDIQPGMEILNDKLIWQKISVRKETGKLKTATLRMKSGDNPSFIADGLIAHNKGPAQAYCLFGICKKNTGLTAETLYRWTIEAYTSNAVYAAKIDNIALTAGRNAFSQVSQTTGF